MTKEKAKDEDFKVVATNRQASHNYFLEDRFEAGQMDAWRAEVERYRGLAEHLEPHDLVSHG